MNGDEFRKLFREHQDAVYRFAWRMTNSPETAEDIAQEVFLTLLRRPEAFDPVRGTLRAFLIGAARNQAWKRWRDESRWTELEDDSFVEQPVDITRGETAAMVAEAVQALAPLQREVLILSEYDELSLEEIAQTVEAEVGTVKSRLFRARENLRRALAPLREVRSLHGTVKR